MVLGLNYLVWALTLDCVWGTGYVNYLGISASILFSAQYSVMILLLFCRLKVIFNGTAHRLSRCSIWLFSIVYICGITLGVAFSFVNDWESGGFSSIGSTLAFLTGLLGIFNISFLTFLFVRKLIDVNKHCRGAQKNDGGKLLSTITKQTILTLISISSLLAFFAKPFLFNVSPIHSIFFWAVFSLMDVWTNFICIFLSYGAFNRYYKRMCGCCDTSCKQLCGKFAKPQQDEEMELEKVESVVSESVETV